MTIQPASTSSGVEMSASKYVRPDSAAPSACGGR
jgi:hypothetical protein